MGACSWSRLGPRDLWSRFWMKPCWSHVEFRATVKNRPAPVFGWMADQEPFSRCVQPVEILLTSYNKWLSALSALAPILSQMSFSAAARSERSNGKRPWFLTPSMIDCRPCVAKCWKLNVKLPREPTACAAELFLAQLVWFAEPNCKF